MNEDRKSRIRRKAKLSAKCPLLELRGGFDQAVETDFSHGNDPVARQALPERPLRIAVPLAGGLRVQAGSRPYAGDLPAQAQQVRPPAPAHSGKKEIFDPDSARLLHFRQGVPSLRKAVEMYMGVEEGGIAHGGSVPQPRYGGKSLVWCTKVCYPRKRLIFQLIHNSSTR